MGKLLSTQNMLLLMGGAALIGTVFTVAVFLLQKSFSRGLKTENSRPTRVPIQDEAAFTLTSIKSVVTQLKTDQKELQEKLLVAERRADENTRKFELIAREIDYGLIVFDAQGYISFSNPLARTMLNVDTWSRHRYLDIFKAFPPLPELVGSCYEAGIETRQNRIEVQTSDGVLRTVAASILPTRNGSGALEYVVCIFREVESPSTEA